MTADGEYVSPSYRRQPIKGRMSQRWVRELGSDTALWLVAVPQWSVPLAQAARMPLPSRGSSVEDLVQSISLAGIAARRTEPSADGGDIELFWVDEASRRDWLEELRQSGDLSRRVTQIATRVRAAASRTGEFVPALTRRWLDLVGSSAGESGDELFNLLARLVRSDKLAEAAVVTDAGAAIGLVQGGSYPAAVWRGRRLVQAGHRRRRDREALAGFVRCDEQITPLRELIKARRADPWALHLLGPGGVGKSMLVRYLASDLFPAQNDVAPFTVARVDFDHISQDYPVDRPVQLLTELADDIWTDAAASDRPLQAFTLSTTAVNAAAAAAPLPPDHPLVVETVERFAAYLQTLPAPQVLVLDTCEELAKLHPAGSEAPAVTRTFQLLEAVHENCPTMRAVFAGRRYLARAGAGWTLPEQVTQDAVASLEVRDYLRLVELKGFDAGDARQVLLRPHPVTGTFPSRELVQAILDRSPEIGGEARAPEPGRYNPFMIAHFRHWWEADPGLTPRAIEQAGPDAYVAGRIVSRLQDRDIADLLPAVIVLGRFDEEMLAAAMDEAPDPERLDQVVQALAEQEWITLSLDAVSGLRVLAVSPGLLPMLWEWARRPQQQPRLAAARERLAGPLRERLENAPLPSLTAELVVAALRDYPPGLSAVAWAGVEQRVETEGRWDWAGNMLRRVRGELRSDLVTDPLLDAALTATALAAQWRGRPTADMSDSWTLVENMLERVEVQLPARAHAVLERLAARARLGKERARPATHDGVSRLLAALVNPDPAPLACVVAALETLLSPVPMAKRIELGLDVDATEVATASGSAWGGEAAVVAGALIALATLVPYRERRPILDLAARQAETAARAGRPPAWADRPMFDRRDPRVWVALHQAAVALATGERVDQPALDGWTGLVGTADVHSVDIDRLMGCCAEFMTMPAGGANGIPSSWIRPAMTRYDPAVRATDAVHRETPSCVFAVARLWYRAGTPSVAEELIDEWRRQALDARADDDAVREADTALTWLAIRMRWADYRPTATAPLRQAPGAGAALSAALGYLADGDASLNADDVIAELTTRVPGWLGADIAAEVQLTWNAAAPDVRPRIETLRDFDPLTACQLATVLALRESAWFAKPVGSVVPETGRLVRELYEAIPARAELPSWGSTGTDNVPDNIWYWWRLRWSVLDGSKPADEPVPVPPTPELLPYSGANQPGTSPVQPRRRRPTSAFLVVAQLVSVAGAAAAGLFVATNAGGSAAAAGWVGAAAAVLGGIGVYGTEAGGRMLRRVARPFVLTVTVFDEPREITVKQDYDHTGGWLSSLLRPLLPRRWGPVPRGDGRRRREPPLRVTASLKEFDSVATVLDPRASRSAQDLEHDLVDVTAEDMWRCVWVRNIAGPQHPCPKGTMVVNGPDEWVDALNAAYRRARRVIRTGQRLVPPLRVVHRVGLPVEAGQGVVMQVSHSGDLRAANQDAYWSPVSGTESTADIDIPISGRGAWLTVIQVTPADTTSRRDARTASLMRRLALDAQRETGNWVLTLPAVPAGVAREIWRKLGRLARRRRLSRHALVRCAGQIKRLIVTAGDTRAKGAPANGAAARITPATARDIAQDVLLIGPWNDQEVSQPQD